MSNEKKTAQLEFKEGIFPYVKSLQERFGLTDEVSSQFFYYLEMWHNKRYRENKTWSIRGMDKVAPKVVAGEKKYPTTKDQSDLRERALIFLSGKKFHYNYNAFLREFTSHEIAICDWMNEYVSLVTRPLQETEKNLEAWKHQSLIDNAKHHLQDKKDNASILFADVSKLIVVVEELYASQRQPEYTEQDMLRSYQAGRKNGRSDNQPTFPAFLSSYKPSLHGWLPCESNEIECGDYIIRTKNGLVDISRFDGKNWWNNGNVINPKYFMPLPQPPKDR